MLDQLTVKTPCDYDHVWRPIVIPNGRASNKVTARGKRGWSHEEAPTPFATREFQNDLHRPGVLVCQIVFDREGLEHDAVERSRSPARRQAKP